MSLEELIAHYGAWAVFFGAAIEGETAAFLGGILAHRQLLSYPAVAVAAVLGSFVADQACFFAGRHAAHLKFVQRLIAGAAATRVKELLERHPTGFILAFRFIYGIRTIGPIAIGLSNVSALKFACLNAAAATVWGVAFTAAGYLFGNAVEMLFGHLSVHRHLAIGIAIAVVAVVILATACRRMLKLGIRGG
ncbi:DedA family protein [Rhizobium sp. BK251]|uniref:DedA family protein n=1 Tax=Rhizobium sp. BK251 TaxID=2512125 RepID=UPI001049543C|nr:DedA family protein [Rhizobium sp. BK251]